MRRHAERAAGRLAPSGHLSVGAADGEWSLMDKPYLSGSLSRHLGRDTMLADPDEPAP